MDRVVTGGAPISNDLLSDFRAIVPNADVMILYGSTEAEPMAHIEARDILFPKYEKKNEDGLVEDGVNVGHFADGIEAKFIRIHKDRIELENDDWTPYEIARGGVGELLVSGLHVCKRYYNNVEATKDTKVYETSGKVWHRTGDLGYQDDYDQVWIVGRVHNVIVRKNIAHFPVKAEIILKRVGFVEKSAFVGLQDETFGEKTWAVVSPKKPMTDEEKTSGIEEIRKALAMYDIPADHIAITEDIPMDPRHHSKVEYPILREKIMNGDL
jgi:acyl-CoA synthetase (AMP-forming)/AMP-acid ligase II